MAFISQENEQLQQEISKLQNKLASIVTISQTIQPETNQGDTDSTVRLHPEILRQKCKQLRAVRTQLIATEGQPYNALPPDENVLYDVYKDDFIRRISQTKECQKFQEHQNKNILENIESLKKVNEELNSIVSASVSKYREIQVDKTSKKLVCERLQAKCTQLDKINRELNKETIDLPTYTKSAEDDSKSDFISKNFPLPDRHMFNTVKKRLQVTEDAVQLMNHDTLLTLADIIELLINKNADDPNDPYVMIDQRYWPPFVELLLECDLILRHQADTRRIKLLPFHL